MAQVLGVSIKWALWGGLETQQLPSIYCVYKTDVTPRFHAESLVNGSMNFDFISTKKKPARTFAYIYNCIGK